MFFQNSRIYIDLSTYRVQLIEKSNLFTDSIYKSHSLPFNAVLDADIIKKLGLPTVDNITTYTVRETGILFFKNRYFNALLETGEIYKNNVELTLYYGNDALSVYDLKLNELPWPVILNLDFNTHAKSMLSQSWPDVSHNWPKVYNRTIQEDADYADFLGFINNYDGDDFVENETETIEEEIFNRNYNVMAPMVYLFEIIRFGYKFEGKRVRGSLFDNEALKKAVYIPNNFLERFQGSVYENFSFSTPTTTQTINNVVYGVYSKTYTPSVKGTYEVNFKLNIPPSYASYFKLDVYQQDALTQTNTMVYSVESNNNRVVINEKVTVNVTSATIGDPIKIDLYLKFTDNSISEMNSFEYSFSDGVLNVFPLSYSLSDFMPDMKFGEYMNLLKNWLNLDIDIQDDIVVIDFVEDKLVDIIPIDHTHLEDPLAKRKSNKNKLYKLSYVSGNPILVSNTGQIFSNVDEKNKDIIEINVDVQDIVVEQNSDVITAVYPDEAPKLLVGFYNGLQNDDNICVESIGGFSLKHQDVYFAFWKKWLNIRTNNLTIKDKFKSHTSEDFSVNDILFKYNNLNIIKQIEMVNINSEYWETQTETETL